MSDIRETIRKALKASNKTRYRLWKETGIDQSQLAKLWDGKGGISLENLEKLAKALDLEIIIRPAKPAQRKAEKES